MLKAGKKTKAWEAARKKLKARFLGLGITHCEANWPHACWHCNGLSFAHSKKRRNIQGDELFEVALLCPVAHSMIERLPEREMTKVIKELIRHRIHNFNANISCNNE